MNYESLTPEEWDWLMSLSSEEFTIVEKFAIWRFPQLLEGTFEEMRVRWKEQGGFRSDTRILRKYEGLPVVYLIRNKDTGICKIGMSLNVRHRMTTLENAQRRRGNKNVGPEDFGFLELVGAIVYTAETIAEKEKEWHERFDEERIGQSEWFHLTEMDIMEFMAEAGATDPEKAVSK